MNFDWYLHEVSFFPVGQCLLSREIGITMMHAEDQGALDTVIVLKGLGALHPFGGGKGA